MAPEPSVKFLLAHSLNAACKVLAPPFSLAATQGIEFTQIYTNYKQIKIN